MNMRTNANFNIFLSIVRENWSTCVVFTREHFSDIFLFSDFRALLSSPTASEDNVYECKYRQIVPLSDTG